MDTSAFIVSMTQTGRPEVLRITTVGQAKLVQDSPFPNGLTKTSTYCITIVTETPSYLPSWCAPTNNASLVEYVGHDANKKGKKYLLCSLLKSGGPKSPAAIYEDPSTHYTYCKEEVSDWLMIDNEKPDVMTLPLDSIVKAEKLPEIRTTHSKVFDISDADRAAFAARKDPKIVRGDLPDSFSPVTAAVAAAEHVMIVKTEPIFDDGFQMISSAALDVSF